MKGPSRRRERTLSARLFLMTYDCFAARAAAHVADGAAAATYAITIATVDTAPSVNAVCVGAKPCMMNYSQGKDG